MATLAPIKNSTCKIFRMSSDTLSCECVFELFAAANKLSLKQLNKYVYLCMCVCIYMRMCVMDRRHAKPTAVSSKLNDKQQFGLAAYFVFVFLFLFCLFIYGAAVKLRFLLLITKTLSISWQLCGRLLTTLEMQSQFIVSQWAARADRKKAQPKP